MKYPFSVGIIISIFISGTLSAQRSSKTPAVNEILSKVVNGFKDVRDFTVTIDAEINMERVQIPKMHAVMYFKKPDKIHFTSERFLIIPRDGVTLNPAVLSERYDASYIGIDTIEGQELYKLQLAAKEKKTRLRQMYAWIDPAQWTIAKIETIPYEGRTLSVVFTYEYVQEKYYLPSKLVLYLGSTAKEEKSSDNADPQSGTQVERMERTLPKMGSITILYSSYKVNIGLDDAIFEEKK